MKRIIARIFGLHTPEEMQEAREIMKRQHARITDLEMREDLKPDVDMTLKTIWGNRKKYPQIPLSNSAPPSPPPPWRPFHPEWLKNPEAELAGQTDAKPVRAIMQLLEDNITREVDDLTTQTGENLTRTAGALEALRNFHTEIASAVKV